MELVSPDSPTRHQTCPFQHFEVLGDCLPGEIQLAVHGQPFANLKECLTVPGDQFIEDRPPRRRREGMEDIDHIQANDRQVTTCLSSSIGAAKFGYGRPPLRKSGNSGASTGTSRRRFLEGLSYQISDAVYGVRQPLRFSRISFSLARSFLLALCMAAAMMGPVILENPEGSPRLRRVIRVALSPAADHV